MTESHFLPYGRKWRRTKDCEIITPDDCERGEWKCGWKLNFQKTTIMASDPITSWQIDGEITETVKDSIFLGSKITEDGDFSHKIKWCLFLGRKTVTNLHSILKNRDITLLTKVHIVKALLLQVVMYRCELDHNEVLKNCCKFWCWRRLLRVPWTSRRSIQSILNEINPEKPLEGLILKLKFQ